MKDINIFFYIINPNDIQEYYSLIVEYFILAKSNIKIHVIFFDIKHKKTSMTKYHDNEEINIFFDKLLNKNKNSNNLETSKIFKIHFFKSNQKSAFDEFYRNNKPDLIFTRPLDQKYMIWKPKTDNKKTVMFFWEEKECEKYNGSFKLALKRYRSMFDNHMIKCYDNIRYPSASHKIFVEEKIIKFFKENKKTCFIPENWAKSESEKKENMILLEEISSNLKLKGYSIVYKKREKYGQKESLKTEIPKSFLKNNFDLIIEKDISYPSSLFYCLEMSNKIIIINPTSVIHDVCNLNKRESSFLILTKKYNNEKTKNVFKKYFPDLEEKMQVIKEEKRLSIEEILKEHHSKNNQKNLKSESCKRLINDIELY